MPLKAKIPGAIPPVGIAPAAGKSKALSAANPMKKKPSNKMSQALNRPAQQAITPVNTDRGSFGIKG